MQPLLLTLGLGLVAVLRAQDPTGLVLEAPDVRLGQGGWPGGGEGLGPGEGGQGPVDGAETPARRSRGALQTEQEEGAPLPPDVWVLMPSARPQVTGTWYVKAMVDSKGVPVEKRPKTVSPVTVTALDGGNLETSFTFMKGDQCHEVEILLEKTEEPGKYTARAFGGKKLVYIEKLPVKDHFVFYSKDQAGKKKFRVGKLLGRNPDVNSEALEEFKKSSQRRGFQLENIVTPVQTGKGGSAGRVPSGSPSGRDRGSTGDQGCGFHCWRL
ncbi:odorant-binding protein 2b-like [Choloepus didactylus]|uniref:odorant-binding protein 2b-like n=1 Tax=Choloepus didactylus TaxID=27675 RepID=UPI00189E446B|nr:odorant-binding protein 2b-like [Choloepus didactylus]